MTVMRRSHWREHLSIRENGRRTGLSRNTVRKYLRVDGVQPKFELPERPSKLDVFGGVPRRSIYDNMRTPIAKIGRGKGATLTSASWQRPATISLTGILHSGICRKASSTLRLPKSGTIAGADDEA